MIEPQELREITRDRLLSEVQAMRGAGYRMVQIGATRTEEGFEINYSFDRNLSFVNLKLKVPIGDPELPSISSIYWCAFIYENELHDLFGLQIREIAVDYQGHFYKVARPAAFAERPETKAKKAAKTEGGAQ